jgi:hypothetical protein
MQKPPEREFPWRLSDQNLLETFLIGNSRRLKVDGVF